jgi:heme oxygenase (mycobilin-producing)
MYVVVTRITVAAEEADDFAASYADSMAEHDGVPGLRRSTLLAPSSPGAPFMATMEFDSREHYDAWTRSDAYLRTVARSGAPSLVAVDETFDLHTEV